MDNSKLPSILHYKVEKKEKVIIENDKPNIPETIHELNDTEDVPQPEPETEPVSTSEQLGLKVVKRPKIKPEKIFEEPPPKKKSRKQIKYVDVSSSEEEDVNKETGEENPNFVYEEEEEDISELKSDNNPEIKNYEPDEKKDIQENVIVEEPTEISEVKSKPKKKGRKPMTAEHMEKLRVSLALAREKKQKNIAEKKKLGYKTTNDIKKEREEKLKKEKEKISIQQQHEAELKKLKDELEEEKRKTQLVKEDKQNFITKEDLQKSQLNTLATFEMMRKERKEEKKKQKQIEEYNESVKETIKKINTPSYMRKAGKYKNYLDF